MTYPMLCEGANKSQVLALKDQLDELLSKQIDSIGALSGNSAPFFPSFNLPECVMPVTGTGMEEKAMRVEAIAHELAAQQAYVYDILE